MKNILLSLIVVSVLIGCNSANIQENKNVEIIDKYVESVENLDFDAMDEILDDNYLGRGPSINDSINKKQAIDSWKFNIETLYKKIDYKKSKSIAVNVEKGENAGEWVSNWAELEIVYKNDDKVTIYANTIYQLEKGKIIRSMTFYNEADVLEQLGFEFVQSYDH